MILWTKWCLHLYHYLYSDNNIYITIASRYNCEFFFSDCETETIYTSQSRDTVSTEDEDDDDDDDDDDMVAEYEPTSGAETEERPPQVTTRHTQLQYMKGWTQIQLLCFKSYNIFTWNM